MFGLFKSQKSFRGAGVAALCVASALTFGAVSDAVAAERLRIAGNFPLEHTATGAMKIFKEELEKSTKGEVVADLFPAMQLGGAQENVDQVRSGTIFAVFTSIAYFTRSVPELDAVNLPFLFSSRDVAFKVMDGPVGRTFDAKLGEKGFENLGYMELGFRHVTNNVRALKTIDDFAGLKIRLQPSETHIASFRAVGANPTAMDIKEVYSALQQGVLDGQENPYNIIATRRFDEVQKHLSDSGHFFDFINVVANKKKFDKLKPEWQTAIRDAMAKAVAWQRKTAADQDLQRRDELVKRGMTFTPISLDTRKALREATKDIVNQVRDRVGGSIVDDVLKAVKAAEAG